MGVFFKFFKIIILLALCLMSLTANNLKLKEIDIVDFVHIVSKATNKNIVIVDKPDGKIEFALNKSISNGDLLTILEFYLGINDFSLIEINGFYKVVKSDKINKQPKQSKVIELINSNAEDVAKSLENLYNKEFVTFSYDKESNYILLQGESKYIDELSHLIYSLDTQKTQVYVEAKILEISESRLKSVGLKYGLKSAYISGSSLYTISSELGSKHTEVTIPSGFGLDYGSDLVKNSLNLWATLSLLQTNEALDVISEPSILALNNSEASIYVGKRQSILTSMSLDKNGNPVPSYERVDIGLKLAIKPRITSDNKVLLEITIIQEETAPGLIDLLRPVSNKKEIKTTSLVSSGENIILGGYIQNKSQEVATKVPLFGDLPIFGNLFKHKQNVNDNISLVVILTPHIIPKSKDLAYIQNQLSKLKLLELEYKNSIIENLDTNGTKSDDNKIENSDYELYIKTIRG